MRFLLCLSFVFLLSYAHGQEQGYDFRLLRQKDPAVVRDSTAKSSTYQKIKHTPVFKEGYISFGGSYRGQYEYFKNEQFNFSPNKENGWYLQRIFLHTQLAVSNKLFLFGELGSSVIAGKEELSPVDKDQMYVNQLFAQFYTRNLIVRLGRENLNLGSRRLVDLREGPNVRRAFDHLSIQYSVGYTNFYTFVGIPVIPREGVFDNLFLHDKELMWGIYANKITRKEIAIDLYYLGTQFDQREYSIGEDAESRHSIGMRIWKGKGKWRFDNEAVIQFGTFGNRDILAWTVSFNITRQVNTNNLVGIKTELISGSTSTSRLGTFNPLYPRGAYFGRVARFGPANLIDLHPYWGFRKGRFGAEIDYVLFWRYSTMDDVYGPPMNIVLSGESSEKFIAQQIGALANYEVAPFFMVEVETNFIAPGAYMRDVIVEPRNLFHLVITTEFRF